MKKPLAIMLLGAALVWGCTMGVKYAPAEDAPAPKWFIEAVITDPGGVEHHVGKYGNDDMTATRLFDNEAACIKFTQTDKLFKERTRKGFEIIKVKYPGHTLTFTCVPDLKKNEI